MRVAKILGLGLVGLIVFVGIAVTAVAVGGAPLIALVIEKQGSALLGRHIRLARLDISWGRPTRIVAEHLTVANATWGSNPNMVAVGRLDIEIEPSALLGLKLVVPHLTLEEGSLLLETATDGERNWAPFAAAVGAPQQRPRVEGVLIRNGTFRYHNGQTGAATEVATDELVAETPDGVSPINIAAKGTFQQDRFALAAAVGAVGQLQSASEPYPVKLKGSLGANDIALDGTIANPLATQGLDLHVEMNGQDIQEVLATLGVPIPKMPIYHLSGQLHRDGQKWWFEQVTGRVGASLLAGRIVVDTGQHVPYIRADLTANFLDLADLQGLYGGEANRKLPIQDEKSRSSDQKKSSRVIPDVRLPIGKLLGFDADFSLDSSNVKPTDGFPFEHFTLGVSLQGGTLRLKPIRVAIARGELLGDLEYRSAETPSHFSGEIEVHHIDLAKLLAGAAVSNSLRHIAGIVGGFAKLSSAGTEQRQILSQLDGDVGIFVQGGRLGQKMGGAFESSLAEALGLISKKDEPPHPVNCLIGRVKVARGVATAETLLLDTAETIVSGRGNINIGDETFFLDFKPYPKRGSGRRIGVPFAIRGTFADPSVTADKVGLIARLGAAIGIGDETPPDGLLQLLEAGLGGKNSCSSAFSKPEPAGQGSTTAPHRSR